MNVILVCAVYPLLGIVVCNIRSDLSDIRMPSLSGIQLARKVKEINFNVKVVLITAFELGDNELSEASSCNKIDAFFKSLLV